MPPEFKKKLSKFWPVFKGLIIIIILINFIIFIGQIKTKVKPLKQTNGLTNILLLGVAGGTHDGADLTDAMILVSFNQKQNKTTFVSLPRDIWSPALQAKINTAYHYGGFVLAKSITEEVTGFSVHYVVKIDLSGFKKLVDLLGGLEINIDRPFDDNKFPIEGKEADLCNGDSNFGCRYLSVHFAGGKQVLNGERVLQYIRSRQAEGDEGTDFSRSLRQEKVMVAVKKKILSLNIFLNPGKVAALFRLLDEITETDLPQDYLLYLWKQIALMGFSQIKTIHFESLLFNPSESLYGQWVLTPKSEDFKQIQEYLQDQLQN